MNTPDLHSILGRWGLRPLPLSGKAIWRETDFGYKHMGVLLGYDKQGVVWVAHNHPHTERIVTFLEFAAGRRVFKHSDDALPAEITLQLLENEIHRNKPYDLVSYNCQHFANRVTKGREDSQGVTGTFMALAFFALGAYILNNQEA